MAYARHGKSGKGLSDRGTRRYAARQARKHGTSSKQFREATTFVDPRTGLRTAKGTFQAGGHTAASLGFGSFVFDPSSPFTKAQQTIMHREKGGLDIAATLGTGTRAAGVSARQKAAVSRGMVGEQTTRYAGAPSKGYGKASMGGMRKGDWQRPQKPKKDTKGGAGIGTIVAVGGIGYLLWSLLK